MSELTFESIEVKNKARNLLVERARVPGGWFVVAYLFPLMSWKTASLIFYPDPGHKWDGGSLSGIAEAEMPAVEQSESPFFGREGRR
jgi:hypothetical protein